MLGFYQTTRFCRWCGYTYNPGKATDRDGFCKKKCKAAHYRAYKKYVTEVARQRKKISKIGNARKTKKKKKH